MDDRNPKNTRRSFMVKTAAGGLAASLVGGVEARSGTSHGDPAADLYHDFLRDCREAAPLPWDEGVLARNDAQAKYAARLAEHANTRPRGAEADLVIDAADWLAEHPEVKPGDTVRIGEAEFQVWVGPSGGLVVFPEPEKPLPGNSTSEELSTGQDQGPMSEDLMGVGSIGPVLATRPMYWRRADGFDAPALVEIGEPFQNPKPQEEKAGAWCCRVRTTGLGDDRYYTLFGLDSLEALSRALAHAGTLASLSPFAAVSNWSHSPYCGFPVIPTMADVAADDEELEFALASQPEKPKRSKEAIDEELERRGMDPFRDGMMGDGPIGRLAATREMVCQRPNGSEAPVLVEIGAPFKIENPAYAGDWGCRQRGPDPDCNLYFTMFGVDGVDALVHALDMSGHQTRMPRRASNWSRVPNGGFAMKPPFPKEWWEAQRVATEAMEKKAVGESPI